MEIMDAGSIAVAADSSLSIIFAPKKWIATPTDSWVISPFVWYYYIEITLISTSQSITYTHTTVWTTTRSEFNKNSAVIVFAKQNIKAKQHPFRSRKFRARRRILVSFFPSPFVHFYIQTDSSQNIYISSSELQAKASSKCKKTPYQHRQTQILSTKHSLKPINEQYTSE